MARQKWQSDRRTNLEIDSKIIFTTKYWAERDSDRQIDLLFVCRENGDLFFCESMLFLRGYLKLFPRASEERR